MATKRTITLPHRSPGRQSIEAKDRFQHDCDAFCELMLDIKSTLDFEVSTRGWCYILEEHGLPKGKFETATTLISRLRKSGQLPIDICSVDEGRSADHLEWLDKDTPEQYADDRIDYLKNRCHESYTPISFWENLDVYIEMVVEKIDLKSLFDPICDRYHIPLQNASGWTDINSRAAIMRRFQTWEQRGKKCILLYCGDHDPSGLHISNHLRKGFEDITALGWDPANLVIERFGLNADFINRHRLSWIDGLETGSGRRLDDPDHPQADHKHVLAYIKQFGKRKVEANALVVRPDAGRQLCENAILAHLPGDAVEKYERRLTRERGKVRKAIAQRFTP